MWKASHVNKEDKPLSIDINYTMAAWHFITLSFFVQNGSMSAIFFFFLYILKNVEQIMQENMWCEFTSFCESRTSFLHFSSAFNNSINISYNSTCLFIGSIGSTWNRIYTLVSPDRFHGRGLFSSCKDVLLGLSISWFILIR